MRLASMLLLFAALVPVGFAVNRTSRPLRPSSNNELLLPANYESWVAVAPSSSGFPARRHDDRHLASKIFVEPAAYASFARTGVWPAKTVIVMELRSLRRHPGDCNVVGLEAAVKNESELSEPWSYYGIMYDHSSAHEVEASSCANCGAPPLDMRLAMYFPNLRAVIDAKPSEMRRDWF